jgi:cobalt-zinc-cadmium efflux system membrane fusion protein
MALFFRRFVVNTHSWVLACALACWSSVALAQASVKELLLEAPQQAALGVRVAPVQSTPKGSLIASAQVGLPPGQEHTVAAPYTGVITRVDVGIGDSVKAGSPLVHIASASLSEARRQWREAQLDVDNAHMALQRDQLLLQEGVIPQARLELTRNRHRAAEAALNAREAELKASGIALKSLDATRDVAAGTLSSPIPGTVLDAITTVGQRVEAGTVLFKVANTRQLQLDISVSVDKASTIRVGDQVSIPERQASAVILGIGRSVDTSQLARARARVTQAGTLQIGEIVPVRLHPVLGSTSTPVWTVPSRSVISYQSRSWVFVVTDKGFMPTPIKVLSSDDDRAVVEGPLKAQNRVAITGLASLRALLQQEP